jgi:hypothetical protein
MKLQRKKKSILKKGQKRLEAIEVNLPNLGSKL